MFFLTASETKMEVKSLISIKTLIDYENSGHLWHKMSQICLKKLRAPCQISSYKFNFQVAIKSADLGLGEKFF